MPEAIGWWGYPPSYPRSYAQHYAFLPVENGYYEVAAFGHGDVFPFQADTVISEPIRQGDVMFFEHGRVIPWDKRKV